MELNGMLRDYVYHPVNFVGSVINAVVSPRNTLSETRLQPSFILIVFEIPSSRYE